MAITLNESELQPKLLKSGWDEFNLAAGKTLKVETSPDGEENLNVTCPRGKQWKVTISVSIEETDV